DYWFVQFDFPDENGKPYKSSGGKMVYNELLKSEIPDGWKINKLAELFSISNDAINPQSNPDKLFKHYSIPNWDSSRNYRIEAGSTINSNKFIVQKGDVLISKLNPWFNRVIYNTEEDDMICSTEFVILQTQNSSEKAFLFLLATSEKFIGYSVLNATGTSNSHKRVNPQTLLEYCLPYDNYIMTKFGKKIFPILERIQQNYKQNQQLTQLRDWLLPMLMNGQVSVK
ncbi:restriction endonuclease subunit S, partial [Chryseobacterium koreense]|uniref:restriction endonuclease subunit S n=1 Tax=Chryseobacterium koreense TaxID=232216 RepID=UPI0026EC3FDB